MILECTKCKTRYSLDDAAIGPSGGRVRCTHCSAVFFVAPSGVAAPAAAADNGFGAAADADDVSTRTMQLGEFLAVKALDAAAASADASAAASSAAPRAAVPLVPDEVPVSPSSRGPVPVTAASIPASAAGSPGSPAAPPLSASPAASLGTPPPLPGVKSPPSPSTQSGGVGSEFDLVTAPMRVPSLHRSAASTSAEAAPQGPPSSSSPPTASSAPATSSSPMLKVINVTQGIDVTVGIDVNFNAATGSFIIPEEVGLPAKMPGRARLDPPVPRPPVAVQPPSLPPSPPPTLPPSLPPTSPPPPPIVAARAPVASTMPTPVVTDTVPSPADVAAIDEAFTGPVTSNISVRPTRAVSPAELAAAASQRQAGAAHRGVRLNMAISAACVVLLLFGAWFFLSVEPWAWLHAKLGASAVVQLDQRPDAAGIRLLSVRSSLYPLANGAPALIFSGRVQNGGSVPTGPMDVVTELRDGAGHLVALERAPLGMALEPAELADLTDYTALGNALRERRTSTPSLAPGASGQYTVVMLDPPSPLHIYTQSVRLAPPPPPPPPQASSAVAADQATDVEPADAAPSKGGRASKVTVVPHSKVKSKHHK